MDTLNPFCTQLASGISNKQQELALDEAEYIRVYNGLYDRKIVVSTNVAESSLTVKGVKYVIDTGLEFTDSYYPEYKSESLLENKIAKSNVKQRRGRAGRTEPGVCYHLYTHKEYKELLDYPLPDIKKTDLTSYMLNLMKLPNINTISDILNLFNTLITPPDSKFVNDALQNLYMLGAITSMTSVGVLTGLGNELSKFKTISIFNARMIIASYYYRCNKDIIKIVSIIEASSGQLDNILMDYKPNKNLSRKENEEEHNKFLKIRNKYKNSTSDLLSLLNIYNDWDKSGQDHKWSINNYINHSTMKKTRQYMKLLNRIYVDFKMIKLKFIGENIMIPFYKNKNSFVFENKIKTDSYNEKLLLCIYIGYIPLICFKKNNNTFLSCNSSDNKNINLNNKSLVNKKNINNYVIPVQIFWSNINRPLKINILTIITKKLEKRIKFIFNNLDISCGSYKKILSVDKKKFKPNYIRL